MHLNKALISKNIELKVNTFVSNKKNPCSNMDLKLREKMFLNSLLDRVNYLRARYIKEQERLSSLSPKDFFINEHLKCYSILPTALDQLRQDFDLSLSAYCVLIKLFFLNNTEHKTSARSLAEMMKLNKDIVAQAIRDLKLKGIIREIKFGQFKKFRITLPLKYRSVHTSDKTSGTKLHTVKYITKFKIYNVSDNSGHSNHNVSDNSGHSNHNVSGNSGHIESKILKSEIKKKVKQQSFLSEQEIREELMTRYQCTDQELDIAFSYKAKHSHITTPHILFYSNIQEQEFKIILEKANVERTTSAENAAKREYSDLPPLDLSYITNALKNESCDEFEPLDFVEAKQKKETSMFSLKESIDLLLSVQ